MYLTYLNRLDGGICESLNAEFNREIAGSAVWCLLMGIVCLWQVSAYVRCPVMGDVRLWELSAYGMCLFMGCVRLWDESVYVRCLLVEVRMKLILPYLFD